MSPFQLRFAVGGSLVALIGACLFVWGGLTTGRHGSSTLAVSAAPVPGAVHAQVYVAPPVALAELAERDPLALAQMGIDRYRENITDYRCVLVKQERVKGKLSAVQHIDVLYREKPQSVYMRWVNNPDQALRALYMKTPEFVNKKGEQVARIEPAGAVARLFVKDVMIPIHGARAKQASRRGIDEFGFHYSYQLFQRYNALATERGVLNVRYGGEGVVDGRPTFIIIREVPYTGDGGTFAEARMVMHIDQEWLLPTAITTYADSAQKTLLGSYQFLKVQLNPGLTDRDFRF